MSFDKDTRNALAKMVTSCRRILILDVANQLQETFGLYPDGTSLPLDKMSHLTLDQAEAAQALREQLNHFIASESGRIEERRRLAYDRLVLEIAFTILNRLAALRLCEDRELVIECVRKGNSSDGFRLFDSISGGALGSIHETYRIFLECMMDELALDLGVLFDRTNPQSVIFPTERCLKEIFDLLNYPDLSSVWSEDETIGWIYQYFNPPEERRAMREASQAPRNSRELAVRNQFFTPRYVVEFLTDNTLGRIWYEMRKGKTSLVEQCRYLIRRPNEIFLDRGEEPPVEDDHEKNFSQEELLKRTVYILHRPKKDPRDIKSLDPACGSAHFLLYDFDLMETIYLEAWNDLESPASEAIGRTLREDYPILEELRLAMPELILRHNLHGIDIDMRAVQIAAFALWLRAQRSWKDHGIKAKDRPRIARSNIVCAEPMPGEIDILHEFTASLQPNVLGQLVDKVFEKMKLAGEAGSLLKIEGEIREAVAEARQQWADNAQTKLIDLYPKLNETIEEHKTYLLKREIVNKGFWNQAERSILTALREYSEKAENGYALRRHLFAEDAARGFALIDIWFNHYDAILMNPPFGESSVMASKYLNSAFPNSKNDIYAMFIERCMNSLEPRGLLGAITSRTGFFLTSLLKFRINVIGSAQLITMADLGDGVLDNAMVKTAAYVLNKIFDPNYPTIYYRLLSHTDKGKDLRDLIKDLESRSTFIVPQAEFRSLPGYPFAYWVSLAIRMIPKYHDKLESLDREVRQGLASSDDFRFIRTWWEVQHKEIGKNSKWALFAKGGESLAYYSDVHLVINWLNGGREIMSYAACKWGSASRTIKSVDKYFLPGLTYTSYTNLGFRPRVLPAGCIFSVAGMHIWLPKEDKWYALGALNSSFTKLFLSLITDGRKFEAGYVKSIPYTSSERAKPSDIEIISSLSRRIFDIIRERNAYIETDHFFLTPMLYDDINSSLKSLFEIFSDKWSYLENRYNEQEQLSLDINKMICKMYKVSEDDRSVNLLIEESKPRGLETSNNNEDGCMHFDKNDIKNESVRYLFLWLLGAAFGRWDVRIARDPALAAKLPDPFDPLPLCPLGMLIGPEGLPAIPGRIVSEEWLLARLDASRLPPDGFVRNPTISDSEYPIRISWNGILVDDPGREGGQPHRDDVLRRIRNILDLLWDGHGQAIEQEACQILGVSDLRDHFCRPTGFFQDHLKCYSKSRRKAPIYWPLSTASGSYTIWLYYHRLNDQTLYAVVNDYLEPKVSEIEWELSWTEEKLKASSGRNASLLRDKINDGRTLLAELKDLHQEILRIAALPYKPDLNDGVIINAAPFHKLFRLRSWAEDTEEVWNKLERGDYDWSHLAYVLWPDRVQEACRKDRSIAIAHGLEDLCQTPAPSSSKGKRGKRVAVPGGQHEELH